MSGMQEIELKFQIPEGALEAVRAEFTRLNAGQNTDLRLRASYFDTPDRRLAAARPRFDEDNLLKVTQQHMAQRNYQSALSAAELVLRRAEAGGTPPPGPADPLAALRAWMAASGVQSGPLFRPVRNGAVSSERSLRPAAVAEAVKRAAAAAGMDSSRYAGHSLRAGFVTAATAAAVLCCCAACCVSCCCACCSWASRAWMRLS